MAKTLQDPKTTPEDGGSTPVLSSQDPLSSLSLQSVLPQDPLRQQEQEVDSSGSESVSSSPSVTPSPSPQIVPPTPPPPSAPPKPDVDQMTAVFNARTPDKKKTLFTKHSATILAAKSVDSLIGAEWAGLDMSGSFNGLLTLQVVTNLAGGDFQALVQPARLGWIAAEAESFLGTALGKTYAGVEFRDLRPLILTKALVAQGVLERVATTFKPGQLNELMEAVHDMPKALHAEVKVAAETALQNAGGLSQQAHQVLVAVRSGVYIPLQADSEKRVVRPWKKKHLEQLDEALQSVPSEHLKDNSRFKGLIRDSYKDKSGKKDSQLKDQEDGGYAYGSYETSLSGNDSTDGFLRVGGNSRSFAKQDQLRTGAFGKVQPRQLTSPGDALRRVQNTFNAVLRHEVGHAVDSQINASGTYGAQPEGGGWQDLGQAAAASAEVGVKYLGKASAIVNWLVQQHKSSGPTISKAEAEKVLKDMIAAYMRAGASGLGGFNTALAGTDLWADLPTLVRKGLQERVAGLDASTAVSNAIRGCYEMGDSDVLGFGDGRAYLKDPKKDQWYSFLDAARARKVSRYQFRAPTEWFAEAYTAFYEPASALGGKLASADPTTAKWMEVAVHRKLVPLDIGTVQNQVQQLQQRNNAPPNQN